MSFDFFWCSLLLGYLVSLPYIALCVLFVFYAFFRLWNNTNTVMIFGSAILLLVVFPCMFGKEVTSKNLLTSYSNGDISENIYKLSVPFASKLDEIKASQIHTKQN